MAQRTLYACQSCGYQSSKWLGRCPECGTWSSFVEEVREAPKRSAKAGNAAAALFRQSLGRGRAGSGAAVPCGCRLSTACSAAAWSRAAPCCSPASRASASRRCCSNSPTGSPGSGRTVLYASAEESPRQLRLRAERLGCASSAVLVVGETRLEAVLEAAAGRSRRRCWSTRSRRSPATISRARRARSARSATAPTGWSSWPSAAR